MKMNTTIYNNLAREPTSHKSVIYRLKIITV